MARMIPSTAASAAAAAGMAAPGQGAGWRRADALSLALATAAGTALSWAVTGHVFGHNNNVFHLPIVAGLAAEPGFAGDAFVQSLRGFSSGLWMLLEGSDALLPAPTLFTLLLLLSKALCLLGLLAVASELGVRAPLQRGLLAGLLAAAPLLTGTAYAGHGGLFINYFSHSELANGFTLLMWWACLRQRFGWALALNGAVFFLNAFMAVWNALPLLWLAALAWQADRGLLRRQAAGLAAGLAVAAALATPVVLRALHTGLVGAAAPAGAAGFDLRQFLTAHYPYHFLAGPMPAAQWLGLVAVGAAALLGLRRIGPAARPLVHLLAAYAVVYGLGMLLPALVDSPTLLKLHLLRVSVNFHFIAALALGTLVVTGLAAPALAQTLAPPASARGWRATPGQATPGVSPTVAALLALALLAGRPALLLCLLLLCLPAPLLQRGRVSPARQPLLTGALCVLALAAAAFTLQRSRGQLQALQQSAAHWTAIARAVGAATPPGAVVLLPLDTGAWQPADAGSGLFEYTARRSVWVDAKRGAAVLWAPAYHAQWQARSDEVKALADWPARLRYAIQHGIAAVIDRCDGLPTEAAPRLLAQAGPLCAVLPDGRAPTALAAAGPLAGASGRP